MVRPLTIANYIKIAMDSHIPSGTNDQLAGAVEFIKRLGLTEATRLFEAIKMCEPSKIKIESLAVKGQVLGFKGYFRCQNVIKSITAEITRLAALAAMISSVTMNFDNPMVQASLRKILTIDPDQMGGELERQHVEFLAFAKEAYAEIYK
jgi:hypothetical protein